ncbi:hypothetical protein AYO20_08284 [Fonsecaea nubica]|uniref:SnoaL-like domain-containing protein n=1 Tax=Fonsecaea nubica TaxID=856822 RepID=A0A178CN34_9EURO|nr:hypothetical protein AYO20_08284 [Fonsecaea nubica]OAL31229.1 hypothetical protein AYO20_08284 [Fonsecaea nubica]
MDTLAVLIAKDKIRDLVMPYSRAADQRDSELMRSLYTHDAVDNHGEVFHCNADEIIAFMKTAEPSMGYTGHYLCNHLISVTSEDEAHGEAYVVAYHVMLGDHGAVSEVTMLVRYVDHYRKEQGQWRFAKRDAIFDYQMSRPIGDQKQIFPDLDLTYQLLPGHLFARGGRK